VPDLPERRLDGISISAVSKFLIDQVEDNDRNNSRKYRFHFDSPQTDVQLECVIKALRLRRRGDFPQSFATLRRSCPQKNPGRSRGFSIRCEAQGISTG
jgi:hypothetical protein